MLAVEACWCGGVCCCRRPDEEERTLCEDLVAVFMCYVELRVNQMCTSGKR